MCKCDPIQRHIPSSLLLGSTPPPPETIIFGIQQDFIREANSSAKQSLCYDVDILRLLFTHTLRFWRKHLIGVQSQDRICRSLVSKVLGKSILKKGHQGNNEMYGNAVEWNEMLSDTLWIGVLKIVPISTLDLLIERLHIFYTRYDMIKNEKIIWKIL